MAASTVCKLNQTGYCKFKSTCRNFHVNDICSSQECTDTSCTRRHPRRCRYYGYLGHCKFGDKCAYLHQSLVQEVFTELNSMKEAISKLSEICNALTQTTEKHQLKMDVFDEEFTEYSKAVDEVEGKVRDIEVELEFTVKEGSVKLEKVIQTMIVATLNQSARMSHANAYHSTLPTPPSSAKKKNQF